jgi:hypothetical protein
MKTVTVTYTIEIESERTEEWIDENIYQAIELGIGLSESMEMTIADDEGWGEGE